MTTTSVTITSTIITRAADVKDDYDDYQAFELGSFYVFFERDSPSFIMRMDRQIRKGGVRPWSHCLGKRTVASSRV